MKRIGCVMLSCLMLFCGCDIWEYRNYPKLEIEENSIIYNGDRYSFFVFYELQQKHYLLAYDKREIVAKTTARLQTVPLWFSNRDTDRNCLMLYNWQYRFKEGFELPNAYDLTYTNLYLTTHSEPFKYQHFTYEINETDINIPLGENTMLEDIIEFDNDSAENVGLAMPTANWDDKYIDLKERLYCYFLSREYPYLVWGETTYLTKLSSISGVYLYMESNFYKIKPEYQEVFENIMDQFL